MVLKIDKVQNNEIESLRTISIQTFTQTFSNQNTEEDMQKYISQNLSSEKLSKEYQSTDSAFYFLRLDEHIVGYMKLNTANAQTELQTENSIEIERIYIKQELHGKKYGTILIQKAIDIATKNHYFYIWLAVWEHNIKAIAFYKKHGFIEFDKHTFKLGNDIQLDIMMKLDLK